MQITNDHIAGISDEVLKVMDIAVANFKKGKVSAPVDLSDIE